MFWWDGGKGHFKYREVARVKYPSQRGSRIHRFLREIEGCMRHFLKDIRGFPLHLQEIN